MGRRARRRWGQEEQEQEEEGQEEEGAAAPALAEEEDEGAEADDVASDGQKAEVESLVVESLEDGSDDQWPTHTGESRNECGALERGGDGAGSGGGTGVIASIDLAKQLSALQRDQDAMHGKLGAVHGELGAVHGKLDAVLAWIATENEAHERGGSEAARGPGEQLGAMRGKLDAMHGKLDAVHGKLSAVLAKWVATEDDTSGS